jgi:glycosyltransferase involved in cell wall biosynthesis
VGVNPKISVIVPIYNAEKYIDRCMESIYAQSFTDYEIILVNDGSKDNSAEICKKYKEKDDRITFIDKENEGAGSARNAGIEIAKGEYLAFPDVDDWFESDMYEDLYNLAKSGDYDVVFSGANFYNQSEKGDLQFAYTSTCEPVCYKSKDECRKNVMTFFPTSTIFDVPWNKLYKRSVAIDNNVRFSDTRRCQDAMFNIDFYNFISSAASTNKAYYNYIENTVASTNRKFPINYIDINIKYFNKLTGILKSWGVYEGKIKEHYDTSIVIAVYGTLGMFENPVWGLDKEGQKKYLNDILNRQDVQDILADVTIREEEKWKYDILKNHDYNGFMKDYKKEKRKDVLRKNKFIMSVYRKLRG